MPLQTPPHGTYSRYKHQQCRCDDCRDANAVYCANRESGLAGGTTDVHAWYNAQGFDAINDPYHKPPRVNLVFDDDT